MSWFPNNKEWLKNRKIQWKALKSSLNKHYYLSAKDKKVLQNYFIFGPEVESLKVEYNPSRYVIDSPAVFAIWFHPSDDPDEIKVELERFTRINDVDGNPYYVGDERFEQLALMRGCEDVDKVNDPKSSECGFSGREGLLCQLLLPFNADVDSHYQYSLKNNGTDDVLLYTTVNLGWIEDYLSTKTPYENFAGRYRIPYAVSCLKFAFKDKALAIDSVLGCIFYHVERIKVFPEKYQPCQIQTAEEFEFELTKQRTEIPKETWAALSKYREEARKKLVDEGIQPVD